MNLGTIQHLYTHAGPFVTVHMDVSRDTEVAPQQLESRWTTASHELESVGVDRALIDQLGERVHQVPGVPGEARRTLVAVDTIVFDDVRAGHSIWPEVTSLSPLPDLAGWLHQVDGQLSFVLVTADREGADIDFYRASSKPDPEHEEVHGQNLHITKVPQGDWAQKEFQQTAENVWRKNARDVADAVRHVTSAHRPRIVLVAGDVRARTEIASALDGLSSEITQLDAGGRAAGSSTEALWAQVQEVLASLEAHDEQEISGRLQEATNRGSGATLGLDDTLDALVQGKVERLVLDLQAAREIGVRPAKHPGLALPASAGEADELPADEVLVAAGAATDAQLSVLPAAQTKGGGIAALLRWDS